MSPIRGGGKKISCPILLSLLPALLTHPSDALSKYHDDIEGVSMNEVKHFGHCSLF